MTREYLTSLDPTNFRTGDKFVIRLHDTDGTYIGYLNRRDDNWSILSNSKLELEAYMSGKDIYYRIPNEDAWLSVSNSGYVGFYSWSGATTFNCTHDHLYSDYNKQKLSYYSDSDQCLYFWNEYPQLRVEFMRN